MKQVFFKTVDALEAAGTAGTDRFGDLSKGKLGFWNIDASTGGAWFASKLFDNTVAMSGANVDTSDGGAASDPVLGMSTISGGLFLQDRIQVVQGFSSGNPLASPIINSGDIARIVAEGHTDTTQYAVTYTPQAEEKVANEELEFKFVIRQGSTQYLDFVNNEAAFADLSDGTHRFPLSGFHNNNHKIINVSISAGAGAAADVCDALRAAVKEHAVLNAMIKTSGTGTAILTARHPGVVFEVIGFNLTDDVAIASGAFGITDFVAGVGNAWQARTEELKARALQGDYNRMYFPMSQTDFVTDAAATYDRFEIIYRLNGDWGPVKGSVYGSAVIYEVNGQNDVGAVLNPADADSDPGSTKNEYIFGRSH